METFVRHDQCISNSHKALAKEPSASEKAEEHLRRLKVLRRLKMLMVLKMLRQMNACCFEVKLRSALPDVWPTLH
jgi:hypothetical protein